jgi:hypothetical protein
VIIARPVRTFNECSQELVRLALAHNAEERWKLVPRQAYTYTAPASTSTITCGNTAWAVAGLPIKWIQNGTTYYGLIRAVAANSLVTIVGPPLIASTPIEAVWTGRPEQVVSLEFYGTGQYGDVGLWYTKFKPNRRYWGHSVGYVVEFLCTHETNATTSQPQVNVAISDGLGSTVYPLTANGGNGTSVLDSWQSSGVGVDPTKYAIAFSKRISLEVKVADVGATRAQDFSGHVTFVLE